MRRAYKWSIKLIDRHSTILRVMYYYNRQLRTIGKKDNEYVSAIAYTLLRSTFNFEDLALILSMTLLVACLKALFAVILLLARSRVCSYFSIIAIKYSLLNSLSMSFS